MISREILRAGEVSGQAIKIWKVSNNLRFAKQKAHISGLQDHGERGQRSGGGRVICIEIVPFRCNPAPDTAVIPAPATTTPGLVPPNRYNRRADGLDDSDGSTHRIRLLTFPRFTGDLITCGWLESDGCQLGRP